MNILNFFPQLSKLGVLGISLAGKPKRSTPLRERFMLVRSIPALLITYTRMILILFAYSIQSATAKTRDYDDL